MVRDAEQYATADKAKKEAIEAKNTLETAIYSAEKSFAEYKVRRAIISLTLDHYVAPENILRGFGLDSNEIYVQWQYVSILVVRLHI